MTCVEEINKMACDICLYKDNCKEVGHPVEGACTAYSFSKRAYEKDYRKVERGEWITPWVMKPYGKSYGTPYCSVCKQLDAGKGNFCPNCGADMRGGAEQ